MSTPYTPPKVWTATDSGGRFGGINRPTAGARFTQTLPVGTHPLQLYSLGTPNGIKVTILLEELRALGRAADYDLYKISIMDGEQFGSDFTAINPNGKIPALMDHSTTPPTPVFESGAILLYLAEKYDAFLPKAHQARTACLCWLFWQMGAAPYLGGGFGHFYRYAPEPMEYPINRFTMETKRQLDLLNQQLATHAYIAGDDYTIADIAIWPWYGRLLLGDVYDAAEFLNAQSYPHVLRWAHTIAERPAVQRGLNVDYQPLPKNNA